MTKNAMRYRVLLPSFPVVGIAGAIALIGARSEAVQNNSGIRIAAEDARPLAVVTKKLEERYGWIITYEDPPYEHETEIVDVTERVRRDGKSSPRVVVPRGGAFLFTYDPPSDTSDRLDQQVVIDTLLTQYASSGNPGLFRASRDDYGFHITPWQLLTTNGTVINVTSVLDAVISIAPGERTLYKTLELILTAVNATSGQRIILGALPINLLQERRTSAPGGNQPARTALMHVLSAAERPLSWQLFYDPGLQTYVLNLHVLSASVQ